MTKKFKVLVLNDTRSEHHHGCSRVMNTIDCYVKKYAYDVSYVSLSNNWQKSEDIKCQIIYSDILIINGEGTIHHNSENGLSLVKAASFAKRYEVKCYLINTTYQGNSTLYAQYLMDFDKIFVRESYSHKELLTLGIESEIVPDLTFAFLTNRNKYTPKSKIIFTDSVKQDVTDALVSRFYQNKNITFSSIFNNNITASATTRSFQRLKSIFRNNSAQQLFEKVFKLFSNQKGVNLWQSQLTHMDYAEFLSEAKVVICGRFHAMTICMNHQIPFLAIESNSHKVSGTLKDIGLDLERFLVTPESIDTDSLSCFQLTSTEIGLIDEYAQKSKVQIRQMFDSIFAAS